MLSLIVFLPLLGAIALLLAPKERVKQIAFGTTVLTFVLSLGLIPSFVGSDDEVFGAEYGATIHHVAKTLWIGSEDGFKIEYFIGVDGLSFPLVILTTLVSLLSCLASWNFEKWPVNKSIKGYFSLFLLLETGMLGVFVSLDFFLFYIFWEVMLLPMYFLIGVWGSPPSAAGRGGAYAAIKFFLYTLFGSVLMLVALLGFYFYSAKGMGSEFGTFNLIELATDPDIQKEFASDATTFLGLRFAPCMFLLLAIGFAIKVPSFPFHTWLPDAHVEAPTPISMILAGVLLKMGAYGFMRIAYPILPTGAMHFAWLIAAVGVISILYGALCAMAQKDLKKLVAYSSISHMGYVMLGLAVMNDIGFQGAMFQVIAHGISSPMCFFLVGIIYERAHHRWIQYPNDPDVYGDKAGQLGFGGLWLTMPVYGSLATLGFFASLGLPGLCGFIGEVWVLIGAFQAHGQGPFFETWAVPCAVLAAFGAVLTAGYILWLIQRVFLGKAREDLASMPQIGAREIAILAPLAVLCILLGVFPKHTLFDFMNGTLAQLIDLITQNAAEFTQVAGAL